MAVDNVDKEYLGQLLLQQGFGTWMRYMFRLINGVPFITEPLHLELFNQIQNVINGTDTRININLPPRTGKTTINIWLVVYALTVNPRSQIIYTSFNQDLLTGISAQVAAIMQSPQYRVMYGNRQSVTEIAEQTDPLDEYWRDWLRQTTRQEKFSSRKITTSAGGVVLFNAIGAAITGFGAGVRGAKGFSGCVICFPYDENVWTEYGKMPIGEIVKQKKQIRVWSYNFKTENIELQPIDAWLENHGDDILEVSWNGASFRCTPEHKVWTLNRGYVSAKNLLPDDIPACLADVFDLCQRKVGSDHNLFSAIGSVHNKLKNIVRQFLPRKFVIKNTFGKTLKTSSGFNIANSRCTRFVGFGNNANRPCIKCNIDNVCTRKARTRKNKSSNFHCVLHIVGFGAISKVFQTIVKWVRVNVTNFNTWCLWPHKGVHNGAMNHHTANFAVFGRTKAVIATMYGKVKHFFRNCVSVASTVFDCPLFTTNTTKVGHTVSAFIPNNGMPLLVRKVGHVKNSYCLTVGHNHNMFVGKTQGFLVKNCDDGDKPADIFSETKRNKTHDYYSGTILTRLNNPDTPIVNTQQRLHTEDLTGYLECVYGFKTFKFPLLTDDGVCTLPRQYTDARIAELQKDAFVFASQYQQSPTIRGGNLIKTEWMKRYNTLPVRFDSLFIVADTAFTEKKSADNSAFGLFGTVGKDLYMIDGYCKKVIFPDLCRDMVAFYDGARTRFNNVTLSAIYIENKGSGISLIQQLREKGLPVRELTPTVHDPYLKKDQVSDKFTRFNEIAADLESGYFHIPESAPWLLEFISECEAFTGGKQDAHDDYCFVAGTKIKTLFGDKPIENIRPNDWVITPFGIRKVLATKARDAVVINNIGLCGTPFHKILSFKNGLTPLRNAKIQDCMKWNIRNLHIWKTKKALCSMEQNTAGWAERDYISYLMQQEMQNENNQKDCMLRCGNNTTIRSFRKGMKFITKTAIHTTVALIIWSVYHIANTCKRIWNRAAGLIKGQNKSDICTKSNKWQHPGTSQTMVVHGINNTPKGAWNALQKLKSALTADVSLQHTLSGAKQMSLTGGGAKNAIRSTGSDYIANCKTEKSTVYNLTVDGGIYFANNILVSNCDVLIYAMKIRRKTMQTDWVGLRNNFIKRF